MKVRSIRMPLIRTGLALGLGLVVAACASQSDTVKKPGATRPSQQTSSVESSTPAEEPTQTMSRSQQTSGEQVEIRRSWVQVRSRPDANAKAIALVFGNDRLDVYEESGDWLRVRIGRNRSGWIPADATEPQ